MKRGCGHADAKPQLIVVNDQVGVGGSETAVKVCFLANKIQPLSVTPDQKHTESYDDALGKTHTHTHLSLYTSHSSFFLYVLHKQVKTANKFNFFPRQNHPSQDLTFQNSPSYQA